MMVEGEHVYDAILVGVGLASTSAARMLADAGLRVALVEGVARSRSLAADGGLIDPHLIARVFDVEASAMPLDRHVEQRQVVRDGEPGAAEQATERRAFRREALEAWAQCRAVASGAEYLKGFTEGTVVPQPDGSLRLTTEDGSRTLVARMIALCEGADPRIALRAGLRPDYGPEDQIHFARTLVEAAPDAAPEAVYRHGSWRTSWGMPVDVAVVPLASGAVVSVAARIENVMRANRSAINALDELLASPLARLIVPEGKRGATGVELVPLRPRVEPALLSVDKLLVSIEASGMLDPRDPERPNHALRAGEALGTYLLGRRAGDAAWDEVAMGLVRQLAPSRRGYRHARSTGFLEEATIGERLAEPVRRLREGVLGRLRGGR